MEPKIEPQTPQPAPGAPTPPEPANPPAPPAGDPPPGETPPAENSVSKEKFDELHGRATRAEAELKTLKESKNPVEPPKAPKEEPDLNKRQDNFETQMRAENALARSGYSDEEIDHIKDFANGKGISMADAQKHPLVEAGINALRTKANVEAATPAPSAAQPLTNHEQAAAASKDTPSFQQHQETKRQKQGAA